MLSSSLVHGNIICPGCTHRQLLWMRASAQRRATTSLPGRGGDLFTWTRGVSLPLRRCVIFIASLSWPDKAAHSFGQKTAERGFCVPRQRIVHSLSVWKWKSRRAQIMDTPKVRVNRRAPDEIPAKPAIQISLTAVCVRVFWKRARTKNVEVRFHRVAFCPLDWMGEWILSTGALRRTAFEAGNWRDRNLQAMLVNTNNWIWQGIHLKSKILDFLRSYQKYLQSHLLILKNAKLKCQIHRFHLLFNIFNNAIVQ